MSAAANAWLVEFGDAYAAARMKWVLRAAAKKDRGRRVFESSVFVCREFGGLRIAASDGRRIHWAELDAVDMGPVFPPDGWYETRSFALGSWALRRKSLQFCGAWAGLAAADWGVEWDKRAEIMVDCQDEALTAFRLAREGGLAVKPEYLRDALGCGANVARAVAGGETGSYMVRFACRTGEVERAVALVVAAFGCWEVGGGCRDSWRA